MLDKYFSLTKNDISRYSFALFFFLFKIEDTDLSKRMKETRDVWLLIEPIPFAPEKFLMGVGEHVMRPRHVTSVNTIHSSPPPFSIIVE